MLDSVGCGELPDAAAYGDEGSDTLGNIATHVALRVPRLRALGLDRVSAIGTAPPGADVTADAGARQPAADLRRGAYGRMAEASSGKDSVTGHWEMMGIVLDRPFPTFPNGFPAEVITEFERRIGRRTIGNVVASGTEIIQQLGIEHVRTGHPIVYTSADSVFQIAAHEDVIPIAEQYRICKIAFEMVGRGMGVGRVIARPFVGDGPGRFKRTYHRRDFAMLPPTATVLDALVGVGLPVVGIGKIRDIYAGQGVTEDVHSEGNADGLEKMLEVMARTPRGLVFNNLVDFDMLYGHRRDAPGYYRCLRELDAFLPRLEAALRPGDLAFLTADHGNDPTAPGTDHTREYVPLLAFGPACRPGHDLGTRSTFADVGATLAEAFAVTPPPHGKSFLQEIAP